MCVRVCTCMCVGVYHVGFPVCRGVCVYVGVGVGVVEYVFGVCVCVCWFAYWCVCVSVCLCEEYMSYLVKCYME